MKSSLYVISALFIWQAVTACSVNPPTLSVKPTIAELQESISGLVSDKSCDSKKHCQSIAYGAKACGGPTSYLIYSLKHTNAMKLSHEVGQYNQLLKEGNIRSGRVSNCSMLALPALVCQKNSCVASRE